MAKIKDPSLVISPQASNSDSAPLCDWQKSFARTFPRAVFILLCATLTFSNVAFAQQGTFITTGSMNTARSNHTATLLNNGKVLVAGGANSGNNGLASAELFDPTTETFTPTGSMNTARSGHTATLLNNGMVLIAGGDGNLGSAELYDPTTGTFAPTGSMNIGREGHTATLLNSGMVLIAGGLNSPTPPFGVLAAELYDPVKGTFALTGSMSGPHSYHTATLLNNGTVLVAGGQMACNTGIGCSTSVLATAELYDPIVGTFTPTGNMNGAREWHTATLLSNGIVLLAGGYRYGFLADAELYDPTTGIFSLTTNIMNHGHCFHTATLLNNGMALIAGGEGEAPPTAQGTESTATAELYDPAFGFFSAAGSMNTAREYHIAKLLNSGRVLVAGGLNLNISGNRQYVASAELYEIGAASPVVSLSPSSVGFADQLLGATSVAQAVTLRNTGIATLNIQGLALAGTNPTDFAIASGSTCVSGASLAPNSSCVIQITFTPTGVGTRIATAGIADNAADSPETVALTGTGQDFSIASSTPTATVAAGQTATYSVSVSPGGGFSQTVSLSCTGAPSLSTCDISPSSVTLNGTSPTPVTVTVATTAPALILPEFPRMMLPRTLDFRPAPLFLVLLILALMASVIREHRKREVSLAAVLSLVLLLCLGITLAACGGGSPSVAPKPGTPAGNYSLTVSGTFTSGSTTLVHNTKLTLVVQ